MARSPKDLQLIPSGGVLVVAAASAVVAAILVNVYISSVRSAYEAGSKELVQVVKDIPPGDIMQESLLRKVRVPAQFLKEGDFSTAMEPKELGNVLRKQAPRLLSKGEFLLAGDWIRGMQENYLKFVPQGRKLLDIHISSENANNKLLQPGAFVTIYGDFDYAPPGSKQPRVEVKTVITSAQVKMVDGDMNPRYDRQRSAEFIQIIVKEAQATDMLNIKNCLVSHRFLINIAAQPEGDVLDPVINPEVLNYVRTRNSGRLPAEASATPAPPP